MEITNAWCDKLVKRLPGVACISIISEQDGQLVTLHSDSSNRPALDFAVVTSQALQSGKKLLSPFDGDDQSLAEVIAIPVASHQTQWVLVAGLTTLPSKHVQLLMEQLEMASGQVYGALIKQQLRVLETAQQAQTESFINLADLLQADSSKLAAHTFCNHLAQQTQASRVSYIRRNWRGKTELLVSSSTAKFDQKLELNQSLIGLGSEAIVLGKSLHWSSDEPPGPSFSVLARLHGDTSIVVVPLSDAKGNINSAVVMQFNRPTTATEIGAFSPLWVLSEPTIDQIRQAEAGIFKRLLQTLANTAKWCLGAEHYLLKAFSIAGLVLIGWLIFGSTDERVRADAFVTDPNTVAITAPADGFIEAVLASPGTPVQTGQLLIKMRDDELRLERLELLSQIARYKAEAAVALRDRNRGEAAIAEAKVEEVLARLELVNSQIDRTNIVASTAGRVADGDLRQRVGSRIDYGENLMTLSPSTAIEIELRVPNRHADRIAVGAPASLKLKADPSQTIGLTIQRYRPSSEPIDGQLVFQAFAEVETLPEQLTLEPGMEGVARLEMGPTAPWRVWILPIVESLALFFWRWLP